MAKKRPPQPPDRGSPAPRGRPPKIGARPDPRPPPRPVWRDDPRKEPAVTKSKSEADPWAKATSASAEACAVCGADWSDRTAQCPKCGTAPAPQPTETTS